MNPAWVPRTRDVWVAAAVSAVAQLELWLGPATADVDRPGNAALAMVVTAPLAWRSRRPLVSAMASCLAFALTPLLVVPLELFVVGVVVLLYVPFTVATLAPAWRSAVGGGVLVLVLVGLQGVWDDQYGNVGAVLANTSFAALGWGAGAVVRGIEQRSQQRVALAESAAVDTVRAQRAEMARDLHDVVAHALSVVTVQAGGARAVLETEPVLAARALEDIQSVSRRALVDMRHLLDLLRDPSAGTAEPVRRPGLDRVDELAEPLRTAGIRVDVVREGVPAPLTPGTETTAVRILQEALTNVLRHSHAHAARLLLRWRPDSLELSVSDDGHGPTGDGAGHGLVGMRERVDLLGGRLEVGPGPDGGWVVRAWLPLGATGAQG